MSVFLSQSSFFLSVDRSPTFRCIPFTHNHAWANALLQADPSRPDGLGSPPSNLLQAKRKHRSPAKAPASLPSAPTPTPASSSATDPARPTSSNGPNATAEAGPSRLPSVPVGLRNLLADDASVPSSPAQQAGTDYEDGDEGDGTIVEDGEDGDEGDGEEGDEEDEEEDEDDDSGTESEEDLEGSVSYFLRRKSSLADSEKDNDDPRLLTHGPHLPVSTAPLVKDEPLDPSHPPDLFAPITAPDDSEAINTLKPKKRRKIQPAESDDEPYIPPPVPTIRLSRTLIQGDSIIWNVLETAKEQKLVSSWAAGYDPANPDGPLDADGDIGMDGPVGLGMGEASGLEPDVGAIGLGMGDGGPPPGLPSAGPATGGLLGMVGEGDLTAEEIAQRLEEKYGDKPKRKTKVDLVAYPTSTTHLTQIQRKKVDYDLEDPFIDDSELQIDAPTHYARPKKEGFFVHMGKVELAEEWVLLSMWACRQPDERREPARARSRLANKAKTTKPGAVAIMLPPLSEATRQRLHLDEGHRGVGSRTSPIMLDGEFEEPVQPKAPARKFHLWFTDAPLMQKQLGRHPHRMNPDPSIARCIRTHPTTPTSVAISYTSKPDKEQLLPPFPHFPRHMRKALMALLDASRQRESTSSTAPALAERA